MKIIKNSTFVLVVLDNGTIFQKENCTEEEYNKILNATESEIIEFFNPGIKEVFDKKEKVESVLSRVENSKILTKFGDSIYWKEVSELSMPEDFILKVLDAEETHNEDALEAYKNFWTLLSLNPDSRCRANLFWYLNHWGMKISKTGLFIGYRNVDVKKEGDNKNYSDELCTTAIWAYEKIKRQKKNPANYYLVRDVKKQREYYNLYEKNTKIFATSTVDSNVESRNLKELYATLKQVNFDNSRLGGDTIYTDVHTHTFNIQIGKMVTMPRSQCDNNQEHQCSSGLHLSNSDWLTQGYYGSVGLTCLCNPADVVCVPRDSDYGKLRTCAYLPIAITEYDNTGKVVPLNVEDGFESSWVKTVLYDGIKSTEENPEYRITIPQTPEINQPKITDNILDIARKYINNKI